MSAMAGAIEKNVVDSENVIRELISDKHMSEEEKRQREAMISTEELRREREAEQIGKLDELNNKLKIS